MLKHEKENVKTLRKIELDLKSFGPAYAPIKDEVIELIPFHGMSPDGPYGESKKTNFIMVVTKFGVVKIFCLANSEALIHTQYLFETRLSNNCLHLGMQMKNSNF